MGTGCLYPGYCEQGCSEHGSLQGTDSTGLDIYPAWDG